MYHVREFEVTNNKVEVDHEVQPSLSSEGSDAGLSPWLGSDMRESFLSLAEDTAGESRRIAPLLAGLTSLT